MKKTAYTAPDTKIVAVQTANLLNTVSNPTETNVDGLGVSDTPYEDDGYSRRRSIWDDDSEE